MQLSEAIKVLEEHNKWRKGGKTEMQTPKLIGEAIDVVVTDYHVKNNNFDATLTKEEKDAETYFEFSDETLGRLTRHVAEKLKNFDAKGFYGVMTMGACYQLALLAHQINADTFEQIVSGFTYKGELCGDFKVTVKKLEP